MWTGIWSSGVSALASAQLAVYSWTQPSWAKLIRNTSSKLLCQGQWYAAVNENTIPVQETDKPNGFPRFFSFPLFMFCVMWTHMHAYVHTHTHTHTSWTYESVSNYICCVVAVKRKNLVMNSLEAVKTPLTKDYWRHRSPKLVKRVWTSETERSRFKS